MTDRLYYRDATLLEFDATIVAHDGGDPSRVILDRTAFYPTSGGQPHDLGTLGGVVVVDVTDAGDGIVHHLAGPLGAGPVHGVIDAERRRDHMQQHTAQHLLSALAADRLGWRTVSVHFGDTTSTIEVDSASVPDVALEDLAQWANDLVGASRPVTVSFEEAAEAMARGLRSPTDRTGEIRVVTIADLDRSACGGTHVATTAAIGAIHLLGTEKVRANTRIGFVAGDRTLRRLRALEADAVRTAALLGCAPAEVVELLPKRLDELHLSRTRLAKLEEAETLRALTARVAATTPRSDGVRWVLDRETGRADLLRQLATAAGGMERVVFVGAGGGEPAVLCIGASADSGIDAGALLRRIVGAHGGKGGGSPRLAQGSAPIDPERLLAEAGSGV